MLTRGLTPSRIVAGAIRRADWLLQEQRAVVKAGIAKARGDEVRCLDVFDHCSDRGWLFANTSGYRRRKVLKSLLPSMPPEDLQRNFIGSVGDKALAEAWRAYCLWLELAARHGRPIGKDSRVLDFGCGWGRTLRFFMREVSPAGLYGVDVMQLAVDTCRQTNPWCNFEMVPALPPTALPAESFDLVYLYSVFSHLSEEAHDKWLDEFRRVLRPGGLLIATTWQRDYIEWCERARSGNTWRTHGGSVDAFVGTNDWLARYDRGEFCHSAVGGGENLASSFYGETCIPEAYVRRRWSGRFDICEFVHADYQRLLQNAIVARRR